MLLMAPISYVMAASQVVQLGLFHAKLKKAVLFQKYQL